MLLAWIFIISAEKCDLKKVFLEKRPSVAAPALHEIPESYRVTDPIHQRTYLIDGELRTWDGPTESVRAAHFIRNADGTEERQILGSYPMLSAAESLSALEAASRAYWRDGWRMSTVEERVSRMRAFVDDMKSVRAEVVKRLVNEIGKSITDAEKEFDRTVVYINRTIEELLKLDQEWKSIKDIEGHDAIIQRAPRGVVLNMAPYNYPLNESFTTLIPAILMGNTIIFKHARFGVLLLEPFLKLFQKHFPRGVVNFIYGDGQTIISPLMKATGGQGYPRQIDVLAFIGSDGAAEKIIAASPTRLNPHLILGLGAKNSAVIMPDADLDKTLDELKSACLSFNGQRCTAIKRIFVHRSRYDEFSKKFAALIDSLSIGHPWEKGVFMTSLPEPGKVEEMRRFLNDAALKGAKLLNVNGGLSHNGFYFPAVLGGVTPEMEIYHKEQFGPMIPLIVFDDISEPIQAIMDSPYKQQASIFTNSDEVLGQFSDQLASVICRINPNAQCQRGPDDLPFLGRGRAGLGVLDIRNALLELSLPSLLVQKRGANGKPTLVKQLNDSGRSQVFSIKKDGFETPNKGEK